MSENKVRELLVSFGPVDGYIFDLDLNDEKKVNIDYLGLKFNKNNKYIEKNDAIKCNILLYKVFVQNGKLIYEDVDHFVSNIGDPLEYLMHVMKAGFFGMISKKCEESDNILKIALEKLGVN